MAQTFLALGYKLSSEAATTRIYVWRALKDLGAASLLQGVSVLPNKPDFLARLGELREKVEEAKGVANIMELTFVRPEDESKIVAEFRRLRDEEYEELAENCERLIYDLDYESGKGRYAFTELEEGEEDLVKLKRWLARIERRDFFHAERGAKAHESLASAAARLADYSGEVFKRE